MPGPKHIKQSLKATVFRVILNPHDLRVTRRPTTHVLIARIMQQALRIPNLRFGDAGDSLKCQFYPPEAPGSELRELLTRRRDVVVGALRDGGGLGVRVGGLGSEPEAVEDVHGGGAEGDGSAGLGERGGGFGLEFGEREKGGGERELRGGGGGGGEEWCGGGEGG